MGGQKVLGVLEESLVVASGNFGVGSPISVGGGCYCFKWAEDFQTGRKRGAGRGKGRKSRKRNSTAFANCPSPGMHAPIGGSGGHIAPLPGQGYTRRAVWLCLRRRARALQLAPTFPGGRRRRAVTRAPHFLVDSLKEAAARTPNKGHCFISSLGIPSPPRKVSPC